MGGEDRSLCSSSVPWKESTRLLMSLTTTKTTLMTQYGNITTRGPRAGEHSRHRRRRRRQSFWPFIILIKTWLEEKHRYGREASATRGIREETRIVGEIIRAGKKLNNHHCALLQCTQNRKVVCVSSSSTCLPLPFLLNTRTTPRKNPNSSCSLGRRSRRLHQLKKKTRKRVQLSILFVRIYSFSLRAIREE